MADHPRACGELYAFIACATEGAGSSPRMRGTPSGVTLDAIPCRIIPAHAGNSGVIDRTHGRSSDHPRACGELSHINTREASVIGSSPRMRGTRQIISL